MPLQIRRGTNAERLSMTVPLAPGEPLYTTDQGFLYIGNGSTLGGIQVTGYQDENAIDAVGNALRNGTHQNIVFVYDEFPQDVSNRIDSFVDLSYYDGEISAPAFRGSILDDSSVTLVNATNGSINLDGTVKGNIIPDTNEIYDIGSIGNRFKDLYLSGSSLYLGNAQITASGPIVDLPAGSTVGGLPISSVEGIISGSNYNANIIADDSSIMVDTSSQQIFAANGFVGNVTGNVTGNVSGNLTGNVSGNLTGNVTGNLTGNVTGNVTGNLTGNVSGNVSASSVSTQFIDGASSSEIVVRGALRIQSDLSVENELFGSLIGTMTGSVLSNDNLILINSSSKEISTGRLQLERNNITTLDFEEITFRAPRYRFDFLPSQTTGNEILTAVENSNFLEIYSEPDVGDHIAGSVTGIIAWSPVDSSGREYGQIFMGSQLDPSVPFTGTYGAQKFFIVNGPDFEPSDPTVPSEYRYLTFDSRGWLAVNQENASATLDINGFAKLAILDTAPTTPANGMVAIADGDPVSGWDPLGLGAPAKQQMVVYLGGSWVSIAQEP
jgi:hypothetical protein